MMRGNSVVIIARRLAGYDPDRFATCPGRYDFNATGRSERWVRTRYLRKIFSFRLRSLAFPKGQEGPCVAASHRNFVPHETSHFSDEPKSSLTIYHLVPGLGLAQSVVVALRGKLKHWYRSHRDPMSWTDRLVPGG
jgi:hypothetical protein